MQTKDAAFAGMLVQSLLQKLGRVHAQVLNYAEDFLFAVAYMPFHKIRQYLGVSRSREGPLAHLASVGHRRNHAHFSQLALATTSGV
jgi:hypothetical protein